MVKTIARTTGAVRQPLIIGVGNWYRRDDSVGIRICRELGQLRPHRMRIVEHSGEGVSLMHLWESVDNVFLFDAVNSGGCPGAVYRIDAVKKHLNSEFFHYSSHAFGVAEGIELARALDMLPARLIVYGIEGEDFAAGHELTPPVDSVMRNVVEDALREIDSITGTRPRMESGQFMSQ